MTNTNAQNVDETTWTPAGPGGEAMNKQATFVGLFDTTDDDFGDGPKGVWGVFDGGN